MYAAVYLEHGISVVRFLITDPSAEAKKRKGFMLANKRDRSISG